MQKTTTTYTTGQEVVPVVVIMHVKPGGLFIVALSIFPSAMQRLSLSNSAFAPVSCPNLVHVVLRMGVATGAGADCKKHPHDCWQPMPSGCTASSLT